MEKLINLLQEFYGENRKFSNENGLLTMTNGVENLNGAYAQTYIISKQGGFIKWLVENEKIEREKFGNSETKSSKYSDFELSYDTPREDYTNTLLMELAIQNEPIQFLIEMLK